MVVFKTAVFVSVIIAAVQVAGWSNSERKNSEIPTWDENESDNFTGMGPGEMKNSSFVGGGETETGKGDSGINIENGNNTDPGNSDIRAADADLTSIGVQDHNKLRRKHGSPSLRADAKLTAKAQKYAESLARKGCPLTHSKDKEFGENLGVTTKSDKVYAVRNAIQRWYDEIKYYNFNKPGKQDGTGHFTAVVWKNSQRLGIGSAKCTSGKWKGGYVVVANYYPAGNIAGRYHENVQPLK